MRPRNRYGASYQKLRAAAVGTRFGDAARTTGVAATAATLTSSPLLVALVTAAGFLPWLLLGLPVGALVDRADKRTAFLRADLVRCAVAAATCGLALTGHLGIGALIVVAFLLTSAQTVSDSCFNSLLPATVPPGELGPANARLSVGQSSATLAGGPAGGLLAAIGSAWPFLANVVTFGLAAGLVTSTPAELDRDHRDRHDHRDRRRATVGGVLRDVTDGFRVVRRDRMMLASMCTVSAANFCNGLSNAALPLLALDVVHLPRAAYGLLMATTAAAMIAGNGLAGPLMRALGTRAAALVTLLPKIPGFLLMTTAGGPAQVFLAVAVLGVSAGLWNVQMSTYVLDAAPAGYLGRVMAVNRTLSTAGTPLGAACAGVIGTAFGVRSASALAVVISAAAIVLLARLTTPARVPAGPIDTAPARDEEGDDLSPACSPR